MVNLSKLHRYGISCEIEGTSYIFIVLKYMGLLVDVKYKSIDQLMPGLKNLQNSMKRGSNVFYPMELLLRYCR